MIAASRRCATDSWTGQNMAWATPDYGPGQINAAGRELAKRRFPLEHDHVMDVVNNWRSAHAFPLSTFQVYLRAKACKVEKNPIIAQRIKRLESIHLKLTRDQTDTMRLTQMQDLGGCRAVMSNIRNVRMMEHRFQRTRFGHKLKNSKDYIISPKIYGYRGIHLVYEYRGKNTPACGMG